MSSRRPVRIANCSGFYGDRIAAAWEVLEGGDVDVLTGDYLAELTMLILWKARQKDPAAGYAKTFLTQMERVMGTCLDRGIRVVSNAGGLNPRGLTAKLHELAGELGLSPKIAYIDGDDLTDRLPGLIAEGHPFTHLDTGQALADSRFQTVTANAYLGAWGIVDALAADADIVVCPRVTDASIVVGPAAWWHDWNRTDYDALAGAVAAGHIIECGPQATGGNYSRIPTSPDRRRPGFPIAEVAADGQVVITKQPGTAGQVTPGTVTAQLLYEIQTPAYANPDVIAHFDSLSLEQQGPDRVLLTGAEGTAPSDKLKVAINQLGGYRNTMTLVLTGLDIEEKAAWATAQLFDLLGGEDVFDEVDVRLLRFDRPDAETNEQATAHLRVTVKSADKAKVGRSFANATMELAVGGYAGFHTTTPPTDASAFGVYWPALVPADVVTQRVVLPDGNEHVVPHGDTGPPRAVAAEPASVPVPGETVCLPLGRICSARSGDKGGNANVGVWTDDERGFGWLHSYLTVDRFKTLVPEAAGLEVRRYVLPRLHAVNFIVVGLLGSGVAATARPDPQAKGLGEYLRSRHVDVPTALAADQEAR